MFFKSLFALSRNRLEYLCLLFGEQPPADTAGWGARDIDALLRYVDSARTDSASASRIRGRVLDRARRLPIPLSAADLETIGRVHPRLRFAGTGASLHESQPGRCGRTIRTIGGSCSRRIRAGRRANYLARESDFQFLKSLEERNLVIPVVGDFGGEKGAASESGAWLRAHGEIVSAFYTSNVEQYLFRDGSFHRFAGSVARLPHDARSAMVRSIFGMGPGHPQAVPGYYSTQVVQLMDRFVALEQQGALTTYYELITRDLVAP